MRRLRSTPNPVDPVPFDLMLKYTQKPYIEQFLGFIGFTDIRPMIIEPTLSSPVILEKAESAAIEKAQRMAAEF